MVTARRAVLWVVVGIAAVSLVVLNDVGRLLGDIQSVGRRSYDASVFTGFKLFFWDTARLADAIGLWHDAKTSTFDVQPLLSWHLLVDALLFVPAYCFLIYLALRGVGASWGFAVGMAAFLLVVDSAETWTTFGVLVGGNLRITNGVAMTSIQAFSLLKWAALAAALVTALALWRKPGGDTTLGDVVGAFRNAREGKGQRPAIALFGLVVLVALFVALVALPAGGPLEQLPDVLRYQWSNEAPWNVRVLSLIALASLLEQLRLPVWRPPHQPTLTRVRRR